MSLDQSTETQNPKVLAESRKRVYVKQARYRAKHPEMARKIDQGSASAQTAKRRGMSSQEFELRIAAQGNRCPIGDHPFGSGRGHGYDNPVRDHEHVTGKNRAILCGRHNLALGLFQDDPAALRKAASYIEAWRDTLA